MLGLTTGAIQYYTIFRFDDAPHNSLSASVSVSLCITLPHSPFSIFPWLSGFSSLICPFTIFL